MAIFWCSGCKHLREVSNDYLGKRVVCPRCEKVFPVHRTVWLIEQILKKYSASHRELQRLQKWSETPQGGQVEPLVDIIEQQAPDNLDLHNTDSLADPRQYEPIMQWFKKRGIKLDVDPLAVDTTGFFDEVAVWLGEDYDTLGSISKQIKYGQSKNFNTIKITLSKYDAGQIGRIKKFCKNLYSYGFISKNICKKGEDFIRLQLQKSTNIIRFFSGEWMEWFAMMKLLKFFNEKKIPVSCLRNLRVNFDTEQNELDLFFLVDGRIPVCIECKTGEFRQHIDKYIKLRKRLKLEKPQFMLCIIGLEQELVQGLNSTHDLTFVNEKNLVRHIEQLMLSK